MKNKLLIMVFTAGFIVLANSCSNKFLERPPLGAYSPAVLQDAKGVEGLLVGAYALLDGIPVDGPPWFGAVSNWVFGGLTSDDAYKGTDAGDQPEQTFLERYVWLPANEHIRGKWRVLFDGISRCNDCLRTMAQVKDPALTDARRKQIEAEARFLRGFYYFEAKKMWNMIPYIDEKIYDPGNPNSTKIPNDKNIWPNIEADFKAAMDVLPETQSEPGRPTKYAAMGMLAKCYLFQGFPNGVANAAKLTAAKQVLDQIIASGKYQLMDKFHDNFSAATRNNKESLFEVQYSLTASADGGGNQGDGLAWPYNNGPGGCCGFYQPAQNLVNAFKTDPVTGLPLLDNFNDQDVKNDEGISSDQPFTTYQGTLDPRLDWTVGRRGIQYLDWAVHPGKAWIRDQAYGGPYSPIKHIAEKKYSGVSGWVNLNANNYRYLRYSMILLWAAECEVEIGSLEKAREYVNMIRRRAANPSGFVVSPPNSDGTPAANYYVKEYLLPWTDKDLARKAVRFEIRLETAMEGHRLFDLQRWGVAKTVLNTYLAKERIKRTFLNGAEYTDKNNAYPIPLAEIVNSSINGKPTLIQNPGY